MIWKYLKHIYLDTQISIMSDNANDVLDLANFQHVTFQQFKSWKLNEATTSSPSPPSSVVHPSPSQATSTSPSISTHLLNLKRGIKREINAYPVLKDKKLTEICPSRRVGHFKAPC